MSSASANLLPKFPIGWVTTPLRYATKCLDGQRIPLNADERGRRQGDYPYWGANGVLDAVDEFLFDEPLVLLGEDGAPFFDKSKPVAFFVEGKIWVNNHMHVLRVSPKFEPRYVVYALNATDYVPWIAGSTRDKLTQDKMGGISLPTPSLPIQRAIADYLDRETVRIDALVAEKERLLGLLSEKRRALITRAVTRGLDPGVPLRDSGIPWLGEIPAHWETVALRFLVGFTSGATPNTGTSEYWDGEIPWVSPKDMKRDEISDGQEHVSELALSVASLRLIAPGAVLIVVRGMILAHSFPTAVSTAPITINQDMKALRCRGSLEPYYLRDFFRGTAQHIVSLADASAHGTRKLATEVLGRLEIALPPSVEQRAIASYISVATMRLDDLRAATESTITLLKERRSALIAAAVTGQLDLGGTS